MKWFWQAIKHLYDISYSEYAEPLVKYSSDIPVGVRIKRWCS